MTDHVKREIERLRNEDKLLQGHKGEEFYYAAWSKKAKQKKRNARKQARAPRRKNR